MARPTFRVTSCMCCDQPGSGTGSVPPSGCINNLGSCCLTCADCNGFFPNSIKFKDNGPTSISSLYYADIFATGGYCVLSWDPATGPNLPRYTATILSSARGYAETIHVSYTCTTYGVDTASPIAANDFTHRWEHWTLKIVFQATGNTVTWRSAQTLDFVYFTPVPGCYNAGGFVGPFGNFTLCPLSTSDSADISFPSGAPDLLLSQDVNGTNSVAGILPVNLYMSWATMNQTPIMGDCSYSPYDGCCILDPASVPNPLPFTGDGVNPAWTSPCLRIGTSDEINKGIFLDCYVQFTLGCAPESDGGWHFPLGATPDYVRCDSIEIRYSILQIPRGTINSDCSGSGDLPSPHTCCGFVGAVWFTDAIITE